MTLPSITRPRALSNSPVYCHHSAAYNALQRRQDVVASPYDRQRNWARRGGSLADPTHLCLTQQEEATDLDDIAIHVGYQDSNQQTVSTQELGILALSTPARSTHTSLFTSPSQIQPSTCIATTPSTTTSTTRDRLGSFKKSISVSSFLAHPSLLLNGFRKKLRDKTRSRKTLDSSSETSSTSPTSQSSFGGGEDEDGDLFQWSPVSYTKVTDPFPDPFICRQRKVEVGRSDCHGMKRQMMPREELLKCRSFQSLRKANCIAGSYSSEHGHTRIPVITDGAPLYTSEHSSFGGGDLELRSFSPAQDCDQSGAHRRLPHSSSKTKKPSLQRSRAYSDVHRSPTATSQAGKPEQQGLLAPPSSPTIAMRRHKGKTSTCHANLPPLRPPPSTPLPSLPSKCSKTPLMSKSSRKCLEKWNADLEAMCTEGEAAKAAAANVRTSKRTCTIVDRDPTIVVNLAPPTPICDSSTPSTVTPSVLTPQKDAFEYDLSAPSSAAASPSPAPLDNEETRASYRQCIY